MSEVMFAYHHGFPCVRGLGCVIIYWADGEVGDVGKIKAFLLRNNPMQMK